MITGRGSWIAERDAEDMSRKLLQENTAKLTAREVIKLINDYCNRNDAGIIIRRELIQEIERKYKL